MSIPLLEVGKEDIKVQTGDLLKACKSVDISGGISEEIKNPDFNIITISAFIK